jgi:HSP20 family molecular chaperone IbpA
MTSHGIQKTPHETAPARTEREFVITPAVDIAETAEQFRVVADMPGVDGKDLEVRLDRNQLTVRGRTGDRVYERSFTLSDGIDREAVKAALKDGVLTLDLPKAREVRPRRIEVSTG